MKLKLYFLLFKIKFNIVLFHLTNINFKNLTHYNSYPFSLQLQLSFDLLNNPTHNPRGILIKLLGMQSLNNRLYTIDKPIEVHLPIFRLQFHRFIQDIIINLEEVIVSHEREVGQLAELAVREETLVLESLQFFKYGDQIPEDGHVVLLDGFFYV